MPSGLVEADPSAYFSVNDDRRPVLPAAREGACSISDLLRFAGACSTRKRGKSSTTGDIVAV
jgi:hypothetical protein